MQSLPGLCQWDDLHYDWTSFWGAGQSKRPYRGINLVALWALAEERSYESGLWATYNQWKELGAQVKRGEKAALIVFWKARAGQKEELEQDEQGEETKRARGVLAKGYHVFNLAQVEGFSPKEPPRLSKQERIERAEAFFRGLGPDIRHGGAIACYERDKDLIRMPNFCLFQNAQAYYSILAHEVTHHADVRIMPHRVWRSLGCASIQRHCAA